MKKILLFLSFTLLFACGGKDPRDEKMKITTTKMRFEAECDHPELYRLRVTYTYGNSKRKSVVELGKLVESPFVLEDDAVIAATKTPICTFAASIVDHDKEEGATRHKGKMGANIKVYFGGKLFRELSSDEDGNGLLLIMTGVDEFL